MIGRVNICIVEIQRYRKDVGYGNLYGITFKNNNEQMIQLIDLQKHNQYNILKLAHTQI